MHSYKLYLLINFLPNPTSNNGSESHSRRKSNRRRSLMRSIRQCKSPNFLSRLISCDSYLQNMETESSTICNKVFSHMKVSWEIWNQHMETIRLDP